MVIIQSSKNLSSCPATEVLLFKVSLYECCFFFPQVMILVKMRTPVEAEGEDEEEQRETGRENKRAEEGRR